MVNELNALLLTTQAEATDFLSHPPERIKRDCIKTQIKVSLLILSGAIIIGIILFENDHTVRKDTGMKLFGPRYTYISYIHICFAVHIDSRVVSELLVSRYKHC